MSTTYNELDSAILTRISLDLFVKLVSIEHNSWVKQEADRIAELTGRKQFRIIDLRLQTLRKQKKIAHDRANGGWYIV